jgi:radical SAM protein with 4Fe4S-binding SPASM domain
MGRAADRPEILLEPTDLLALFPRLARLKARADDAGVRLWPGNNIGYFGPYEEALRGSTPRGHGQGCGAGCNSMGIEADGAIKGCPSLPSDAWTGGTVREHALADIWERAEPLRYVRHRSVDDLWGYCRSCYYADTCRGGCTWTAHTIFGRPGNNPFCHHRVLEFARRGLRERLIPTHRPPGQPFDYGRFELSVEPIGAIAEGVDL